MTSTLLRNRSFLLLWLGQTVSSLGSWINFVGLNLLVYQLSGSGKVMGAFLVVRLLPAVLFGALGGWLADRYPRKSLMLICDSSRALLVLGFVFITDLRLFFLLGFLLSAVDKIFMATRGAFLPDIVKEDDLLEANSFQKMTLSIITVVGPAVGGLLVALYSFRSVFIIDSATFVTSVACISLIRARGQKAADRPSAGVLEEFKTAFSFFGAHSALVFLTVIRLVDAMGSGAYNTALPVFSKTLLVTRGAAYGWLVGAWGLGEFTGAYVLGRVSKRVKLPKEELFSASVVLMALGMGLTFWPGSMAPALVAIFLGGVGDGVSNILFNTTLMKEAPSAVRGKVYGCVTSATYTAVALGMVVSGLFIDRWPLRDVTNFASLFIMAGVATGYIFYALKRRRRTS